MIIYLAKFILCSGLFLLAYSLLLAKEKAHVFKRFYLLASLLFSFIIPSITIESEATANVVIETAQQISITPDTVSPTGHIVVPVQTESATSLYLILAIYVGISTVLFLRFGRNILMLWLKIKHSPKTSWNGVKLVLSQKPSVPFSFINYIFVSKTDYEQGFIAKEILQHEQAHIAQKHSVDVIFIELLQICLWFNPFLYFYRKAIQTNHEYLADEAVINTCSDISNYQLILIQQVSKQSGLSLTSQFNYLTIKKRLLMMSKTNATKKVLAKQIAILPIMGLAVLLFATRTVAQNNPKQLATKQPVTIQTVANNEGISTAELTEFHAILAKYKLDQRPEHYITFPLKLEKTDDDRLFVLYRKMSKQQLKNLNAKIVHIEPAQANIPSKKQLTEWQNARKYGVWIDEKRVDNTELAKYQASDFKHWDSSKLTEKAINYGKHYFQIDLMTKAYYKAYYAEASQHKPVMVCFLRHNQAK